VVVQLHDRLPSAQSLHAHIRLTSSRAAERDRIRVSHQTAAPMGSVMSNAVPANVPATRKGQKSRAYVLASFRPSG